MAGLRGLRLYIYDALLHQELVDAETATQRANQRPESFTEAVGWLARHRFILAEAAAGVPQSGAWRARPVSVARELFERSGPAEPERSDPSTGSGQASDVVTRDPQPAAPLHVQLVSWW